MYMPFQLAFGSKGKHIIFESFNPVMIPEKNGSNKLAPEELKYSSILGYTQTVLDNFVVYPIDNNASSTFWKNMIFSYTQGAGTGSSLVYFDWVYMYYHYNFLRTQIQQDGKYLNVLPSFYHVQKKMKEKINAAADDKDKNEAEADFKEFSELNSNLFVLDSESPIKEIQFHIGKMLASFILLNTGYEFSVPGKILRRPNEIIKINKSSVESEDFGDALKLTEPNTIYTTNSDSNTMMMYVRRVVHQFKNNNYTNRIFGNRIYDSMA